MSRTPAAMPAPAIPALGTSQRPAARSRERENAGSGLASTMAAVNVVMTQDRRDIAPSSNVSAAKKKPKTREGKKGLVLYLDPAVPASLRRLAALLGRDVQSLGQEALGLLFAKYEAPKPPATKRRATAAKRARGA